MLISKNSSIKLIPETIFIFFNQNALLFYFFLNAFSCNKSIDRLDTAGFRNEIA